MAQVIYILFWKREDGDGIVKAFTGLNKVSEYSGISYWVLVRDFQRERAVWRYYEDKGMYVLVSRSGLEKMDRGKNLRDARRRQNRGV